MDTSAPAPPGVLLQPGRAALVALTCFAVLGLAQMEGWMRGLDKAASAILTDGLEHDVAHEATCRDSMCQYPTPSPSGFAFRGYQSDANRTGTWNETYIARESVLPWAGIPSELGASGAALTLAIATSAILLLAGTWRPALIVLLVASLGGAVVEPLKDFFPGSFPSGHTVGGTMGWGLLFAFVPRALAPLAAPQGSRRWALRAWVATALLVGFDRVHIGAHPLSDVLAGWVFGAALVFLAVLLDDRWAAWSKETA